MAGRMSGFNAGSTAGKVVAWAFSNLNCSQGLLWAGATADNPL